MEDKGLIGGSHAALNLPPNSSIPICYHSLFGPHDDLLLLELDDKVLTELLHHGVTVRGQPNEEAVLCTPSTTYAIKFVSTSNSVFLIPPSDLSSAENRVDDRSTVGSAASVIKVSPGTMELVQVAPRLDKLRSLLSQKPFRLDDENEGSGDRTGLYRWIDLVDRIQSSDEELRAGLRALSAVEIDGYWRIVDEKSMDEILSIALHNAVLYGWSLNALKEDEVLSAMVKDGFSQTIALHCLETYGNKAEDAGEYNVWSFNERRVCVHFARRILSRGKGKMEIFMDEWIQSIPTGFCASLEMLEGEMLVERIGVEMWVRAFSVYSLPSDPAERFSVLFRERQKWEWKDLQPYIRDLRVPGLSSEGLLIKYTRRTQPTADAEPVFSAR